MDTRQQRAVQRAGGAAARPCLSVSSAAKMSRCFDNWAAVTASPPQVVKASETEKSERPQQASERQAVVQSQGHWVRSL